MNKYQKFFTNNVLSLDPKSLKRCLKDLLEDERHIDIVETGIKSSSSYDDVISEITFNDYDKIILNKDGVHVNYDSPASGLSVILSSESYYRMHHREPMNIDVINDIKHSVSVVLINEDGLVLHVSRKDNHSKWTLPGGKVDSEDSSLEEAAVRETMEETGVQITNLTQIYSSYDGRFMGHTFIADYVGEIDYDKDKEPHLVEWKPLAFALSGPFSPWNEEVVKSLNRLGVFPIMSPITEKEVEEIKDSFKK